MKETPFEILEGAIWGGMMLTGSSYRRPGVPGQIIERLSDTKREILRQLKSEDIANVRPDVCFPGEKIRSGRSMRWRSTEASNPTSFRARTV